MIKEIQATYGIKQRIREQWIGMSNSSICGTMKVLNNYSIYLYIDGHR